MTRGLRPWAAWLALAAAAAPLALVVIGTVHVLRGPGPPFLAPTDDPIGTYTRLAYLVQVSPPDRSLVLALLALAAATWLVRQRRGDTPLRWAGVGLTVVLLAESVGLVVVAAYLLLADEPQDSGVTFSSGDPVESLSPLLLPGLVLTALAVVLGYVLLSSAGSAARDDGRAKDARTDDELGPQHDLDDGGERPSVPLPAVAEVDAVQEDPHARYRRPSA